MTKKLVLVFSFFVILLSYFFFKKAKSYTELFGYSFTKAVSLVLKSNSLARGMDLKYYHKPTILILGVDERNDKLEHTEVTDTIMLAQLNLLKNTISIVSLPRDTWDEKFKFKLNSFYPYAIKNYQNDWQTFLKTEFARITGQPIDNIILINTQSFDQLAKIIGPVSVDLPYSFTDTRYPNPAYVQNPSPSIPIYKIVSFSKGANLIDSQNVLEFVRSRKSSDNPSEGGTDLGRIARQQLLLDAYLAELKSKANIKLLASLYQIFHSQIKTDITDQTALIYAQSFENLRLLQLNKIILPVNTKNAVISDPGHLVENQSVLLPTNNNFQALIDFLKTTLP